MILVFRRICMLAFAAFLASGQSASAAATFNCAAPESLTRLKAGLPVTARAFGLGKEIVIVAVGSSSTEGVGASSAGHTYPARLARALSARWPNHEIRVINSGVGGETARDMLVRFEKDVVSHKPHLVIWQTGSNTVLKGAPVDDYVETVHKGVTRLRAAGADIILMDPQYAPRILRQPALLHLIDLMRRMADDLGVGLFRRHAIMRHWIDNGQARLEDMISRDGLHMNDASYDCAARLLADIVTEAAQAPSTTARLPSGH